ncbi:MAG: hypothetical protein J1D86_08285, partial [Alistipes sp.]|nr:hypothetical protein [Alistipes sp.]
ANGLSLTFSVDGEDVEAYSTVSLAKGDSVEIEIEVEGASENAVVKAELQNPDYGFKAFVDGYTITVNAIEAAVNKLLVEVQDGANCYHSWLSLKSMPNASISIAEVDDYDYMPVAFGDGYESLNSVSVNPTVLLTLDAPAPENLTFTISVDEVEGDEFIDDLVVDNTVTVNKGESSVVIPASIATRTNLVSDSGVYISATAEGIAETGAYFYIANNFSIKADLTANDLSCQWSHGGPSVSLEKLVDGSTEQDSYWESYWSVGSEMYTNADYHIYIDINLPMKASAVKFRHYPRNTGVAPASLKYAAIIGGQPEEIGTKTFDTTVAWQESEFYPISTPTDNVWFGMMESAQGDLYYLEPSPAYCHCVGLRELEVHIMY